MLTVYIPQGTSLERRTVESGSLPDEAVWIDLISPTVAEYLRDIEEASFSAAVTSTTPCLVLIPRCHSCPALNCKRIIVNSSLR